MEENYIAQQEKTKREQLRLESKERLALLRWKQIEAFQAWILRPVAWTIGRFRRMRRSRRFLIFWGALIVFCFGLLASFARSPTLAFKRCQESWTYADCVRLLEMCPDNRERAFETCQASCLCVKFSIFRGCTEFEFKCSEKCEDRQKILSENLHFFECTQFVNEGVCKMLFKQCASLVD